jgi:hypothetical protein
MARKAEFRIVLDGAGRLEDLPLADIAELLRGLVVLVARGAAEELNRPIRGVGRWEAAIEEAAALRLVRLRNGSLVADVVRPPGSPPAPSTLGLVTETLTDRAFDRLVDVAEGKGADHPTIAAAFADLLDRFATLPTATIRVQDLRPGHRRKATVAVSDRKRLRALAAPTALSSMDRDVTGRLYEADLEAFTARVRTPAGERVDIGFGPDLEPDVKRLLGDRASLRGELVFDGSTNKAKALQIREILAGDQLEFGAGDFWSPKSLAELSAEQGTGPIADPGVLAMDEVSDVEWEAFYEALGVAR